MGNTANANFNRLVLAVHPHIPTPSGKAAWSHSTLQSILGQWERLYQYTGYAFWNREDCTDKRNRYKRDTSEWVVVPNAHPAIITEDECNAIYAIVKDKKRTKTGKKGKASRWALSGGLIRCKSCGANFAGCGKKGDDRYRCGAHIYRRGAGCTKPSWSVPREALEATILDAIIARLESSDAALQAEVDRINHQIRSEWQRFQKTAQQREEAEKRLKSKLNTYYELATTSGITDDLQAKIAETTQA